MRRRKQRVDAAAGADVERTRDARPGRERVAEAGRRRVDGDVVGRVVALRVAVRCDQQPSDREDAHAGNDLLPENRKPGGLKPLDTATAERTDSLIRRDRALEEEHADDRRELAVRQPPLVGGCLVLSTRVRILAEQLVDGGLGVADATEREAEALGRSGVRDRIAGHRAA